LNIAPEILYLVIAILLILSVMASKFSDRLGVPALLIFLGIGMLAGSEGLGGIYFDDPAIAQTVGLLALIIILFSGGLDTDWHSLRGVTGASLTLSTLGVLLTTLLLGAAAHYILNIPWLESMLLAAVASSTDAAAVFAQLRSQGVNLKGRLAPLLELESGSNDPMAVFLTIGLIQLLQNPGQSPLSLVLLLVQQMLIGALFGVLVGRGLIYAINRLKLGYDGLYPVLALGAILMAFGVTTLLRGSGILAVYLVGLMLARTDFLHKRSLSRFFDGMAWLFQIIMFLTLGLLVFPSRLMPIIIPGLLLSLFLILIARPVAVWLSLIPFKFTPREKFFISWVGLRGAVPIILATYPRLANINNYDLIFNIVFFVVITSVLVQGTTLTHVAKLLKLDTPPPANQGFPLESQTVEGWPGALREHTIRSGSTMANHAIFELGLPAGFLIILINRRGQYIIPNGSIVLQENDRLLGLATPDIHRTIAGLSEPAAKPEG